MARVLTLLHRIVDPVLGKLRILADRFDARAVPPDGLGDIPRVPHAVHVADLVSVVSGDWYLGDPESLVLELDDDFGIEVEVVSHLAEVDPLQRLHAVGPVAAVELRQVHPQRAVFHRCQNPVAQVFVQRHAAL